MTGIRGFLLICAVLAAVVPAEAETLELLWSSPYDFYGESLSSVSYPSVDREAADDFEATGTIKRLLLYGRNDCTFGCIDPPQPTAVRLRLYEWSASGPGAVTVDLTIPGDDPGMHYDTIDGLGSIDLTLTTPLTVDGRYFLSVQPQFGETFNWSRSPSNEGSPTFAHTFVREDGGGWVQATDFWDDPVSQDLAIDLYGCPPAGCAPDPTIAECGTWSELPSPTTLTEPRIEGVAAIAPWDVWVVGSHDAPVDGYWNDRQQSLAMHWNGQDWQIVPTPSPSPAPSVTQVSLNAVDGVAGDDVWAVGRKKDQDAGGYTGGRVFALRWDGLDWTEQPVPWPSDGDGSSSTGASGEQLNDVDALATDDVWMVGTYWWEQPSGPINWPGVAIRWNGSSFERYPLPMISPSGNQSPLAVAAIAADDVWVVGEGNGPGAPAYIWHWDGSDWSAVSAPTPGEDRSLESIAAIASDDVWVGGWYRDAAWVSHPLLLHWDGLSWTQFTSPAGGNAFAAWAADDILTFGVGGWAHWDGATWSAEDGPQVLPSASITGLAPVSPCNAWAVGRRFAFAGATPLTLRLSPDVGTGDQDLDGVPDGSDNCPANHNPDQADCDLDGVGDVCELVQGTEFDCNANGSPDSCESFDDCNGNAVPDECEPDCNANGTPDACDIAGAVSADCQADGIPDECQSFPDCNLNGVDDGCDLAGGFSTDANGNAHPDECEALGAGFATVTTIEDDVDFGGAQQLADLPGPDGVVSLREAVIAANNTPGPQTVAFNVPRAVWSGFDPVAAELRIEDGPFVLTDDGTVIDFTTQTAFTGDTNPAGPEIELYGYQPNSWGVTAIQIYADDCTVHGIGRVGGRGYAVQIAGNRNRVTGSTISGPLHAGIYITGGWEGPVASDNVIEGNTISGGDDGVRIDAPAANNVVSGNVIGGGSSGISIRAGSTGNRIVGNVLSGSGNRSSEGCPSGEQIDVLDSDDNVIENNLIGLRSDGLSAASQRGSAGIEIRGSDRTVIRGNTIGGILTVGTNHCSGDRVGNAIIVTGESHETLIEDNRLGVSVDGLTALPNRAGVVVSQWIAGEAPSSATVRGNLIRHSELDGVIVGSGVSGVTIDGNRIWDNDLRGIVLAGDANASQPAPTLDAATTDGGWFSIDGTLVAAPDSDYRIELFANDACDPSGFGEGQQPLGTTLVTTDATGAATFSELVPVATGVGNEITATATHLASGNSSEFSQCLTAIDAGACLAPPGELQGMMVAMGEVTWQPWGTSGTHYAIARGELSGLTSTTPATCLATDWNASSFSDPSLPTAGTTYYYLVRGSNACGDGAWGVPTDCP